MGLTRTSVAIAGVAALAVTSIVCATRRPGTSPTATVTATATPTATPTEAASAASDPDDDDPDEPVDAAARRRKAKPCAVDLDHCPLDGCAAPGTPHAVFNRLKRRATTTDGGTITRASATPVTFDVLRSLHALADGLVGQKRALDEEERKKLAALKVGALTLGEGSAVRLAGYVAPRGHGASSGTHPGGIESVNCRLTKDEWRDLHIDVMPRADVTECDGVVVEMIPQGRDAHPRWTVAELDRLATEKKLVLFVGPLFYDNEHRIRPDCSVRASEPKRMSLWEIHPVVELWVCDDGACTADAARGWKRFD